MKFCFIASNLDIANGNGRFVHSFLHELRSGGHDALVLIERGERELLGAKAVLYGNSWIGGFILNPFIIAYHVWRYGADAMHAFDAWPWGIWAFFAYLLTRIPFGMTIYATYGVVPLTRRLQAPLLRGAYRASVANVAISHVTAQKILNFLPDAKIDVIPQGIDFAAYQGPTQTPRITSGPYILTIAYMKPRKGYDVAMPTFAKVKERFPNLKYVIRAPSSNEGYARKIRELAHHLGIADSIIWLPRLEEQELMDVYKHAAVFFLPSISSHPVYFEGFGSVYLEAQACGIPVVTSRGGGQEDAMRDGETGFLIPEGDINAAANALARLLGDPQEYALFSRRARDFAHSMDWRHTIQRYLDLYTSRLSQ